MSTSKVVFDDLKRSSGFHFQLKPDPEFLNNRLLSVEVTDTSAALVMTIMKVVDSISPFVNFLPLANRVRAPLAAVGFISSYSWLDDVLKTPSASDLR